MYELVYPVSCQIVQKQGYLHRLMDFHSELSKTNEQFAKIREKMEQYLKRKTMSATVQR